MTQTAAFVVSGCELACFLMGTLLVTQTGLFCFSGSVGHVFNVHSTGDTEVIGVVSGGQLAWFLTCTLLVMPSGLSCFSL